ncbi:hypothetical protein PHAMO_380064 [Magnetospirillum molischianum DSM 120]|uniref:Uncharacterized protein n=1 Tax=Magnetospirillum molischianum DSM 120 TaxID=1150626 RepID=H8FVK8_MAGML|nr:hypothetical protein PHAMO_380064 [Magnetospirillum molischianum DSM 120]
MIASAPVSFSLRAAVSRNSRLNEQDPLWLFLSEWTVRRFDENDFSPRVQAIGMGKRGRSPEFLADVTFF